MNMRTFFVCCLCSVAMYASAAERSADFFEGVRLHDEARGASDAGKIERAKALLEPLIESDPLALGYYGSAISLEAAVAAEGKNGLKALGLLKKSGKLIDEAVRRDPENVDLRFLRMINSYGVSSDPPVKRWKEMKTDIDWLKARRSEFSAEWQGSLYLYEGHYLARSRDIDGAVSCYSECVRASPGSAEAREAEMLLSRYEE